MLLAELTHWSRPSVHGFEMRCLIERARNRTVNMLLVCPQLTARKEMTHGYDDRATTTRGGATS